METDMIPIILITADELRKDALGCYGGRAIKTPNFDSLAETGMCFDRAYTTSPWCLPARCSILTGLFPHNTGAYSNFRVPPLDPGIPNMFKIFKEGGYTTALFGKCHFAPVPYSETRADMTLPYEKFREYYVGLGLDHLDLQDDKQVSVWFYDDYAGELEAAGYLEAYRREIWDRSKAKRFVFPGPKEWHPDEWVGRKAVEYIENYGDEHPPFMWISFSGPHYPFDPPAEYLDRVDMNWDRGAVIYGGEFDNPDRIHHGSYHGGGGIDGCGTAKDNACKNYTPEYWRELRRNYFANMALMDDQVGNILRAVSEKFGEAFVIFTADHGEMLGNHGLWGKNNCFYEDVWNVPFLMKGPGVPAGVHSEAMIMTTDILPTFQSAAGLPPINCDGEEIMALTGRGGHELVFAEGENYAAVFDGRVKYVKAAFRGKKFTELIDLAVDPNETENKINDPAYTSDKARLTEKLCELFMGRLLK